MTHDVRHTDNDEVTFVVDSGSRTKPPLELSHSVNIGHLNQLDHDDVEDVEH